MDGIPDAAVDAPLFTPPPRTTAVDAKSEAQAVGINDASSDAAATATGQGSVTMHFSMDEEDDELETYDMAGDEPLETQRADHLTDAATSSAFVERTAPEWNLATEVRNRFAFLTKEEQQTVCRRECQLAHQAEEELLRKLQVAIENYGQAMETSKVVVTSVSTGAYTDALPDLLGLRDAPANLPEPEDLGISQETRERYEGRVSLLKDAMSAIRADPVVTLPKLTKLESVKGFAFSQYARAAIVADRFTREGGVAHSAGQTLNQTSQAVNLTVAQAAPEVSQAAARVGAGLKGAFGGLASRLRSAAAPATDSASEFPAAGGGVPSNLASDQAASARLAAALPSDSGLTVPQGPSH